MTDEFDTLVDRSIISSATETHLSATSRLAAATTALNAAKSAHAAAQAASEEAISGLGDLSPLDAEHALNAAALALTVAGKVHASATVAHRDAVEGIAAARGDAHKPVYVEGIRRRLAAAQKADVARAALVEAQKDHDAATALLNHATQNGTQHVIYDASHGAGRPVGTYSEEVARWSIPNGFWHGKPV